MIGIVKSIIDILIGFLVAGILLIIVVVISNTIGYVSPLWQPSIDIIGAINTLLGIPIGLILVILGSLGLLGLFIIKARGK